LKHKVLQFILIIFFLTLFTGLVYANSNCSQVFINLEKQEYIPIHDLVKRNDFETGRKLVDYYGILHQDFKASLQSLYYDQAWLDLGAGRARAQLDYLNSFHDLAKAAQLTAVTYKSSRWFWRSTNQRKLKIIEGAFENFDVQSSTKYKLITDVFGVVSYTLNLHRTLQNVFDLLEVNGEFYVHIPNYLLTIQTRSGNIDLKTLLSRVEGLLVEGQWGTLKITKLKKDIRVPELELSFHSNAVPVNRIFRLVE